jgi:hypothetical protein
MRTILIALTLCCFAAQVNAHSNYTGRSGAPGRNTCASSCHGNPGGTVSISNFPATYTPGQNYLLTISRASGNTIQNFNTSCRVGTGTTNAGVIAAGTGTATYNVTGETNGVHLATNGQTSATFNWTAPIAGTGTVRLYTGAYQGNNFDTGLNTTIVLISDEAPALPSLATNPSPADLASGILLNTSLSWTAGSGATSHDVYFGVSNPPASIGNQAGTVYDPAGDLLAGTAYYWRIDERNGDGATTGTLWQFTTLAPPPDPQHLVIKPVLPFVQLYWDASSGAASYNVYRDATLNVAPIPGNLIANVTTTTYTDTSVTLPASMRFYIVTASTP